MTQFSLLKDEDVGPDEYLSLAEGLVAGGNVAGAMFMYYLGRRFGADRLTARLAPGSSGLTPRPR